MRAAFIIVVAFVAVSASYLMFTAPEPEPVDPRTFDDTDCVALAITVRGILVGCQCAPAEDDYLLRCAAAGYMTPNIERGAYENFTDFADPVDE